MTLHNCPKCNASCLFPAALNDLVTCHACGAQFRLTRYTKTERDALTRVVEFGRLKVRVARTSRRLVYAGGLLAAAIVLLLAMSVFGLLPDEWRLIHRRFASVSDEESLKRAVGLVMVARENEMSAGSSIDYFTAVAISSDGYMLTSRRVLGSETQRAFTGYTGPTLQPNMWVFVAGRRFNAHLVGADKISDYAVIRIDEPLGWHFRLAKPGKIPRLNADVQVLGYEPLEAKIRSPLEWPLGQTRGTVNRIFSDDFGTEWIEHSAPVGEHTRGAPLIYKDVVVAINVETKFGITSAVSIGPYRESILRMIDDWEEHGNRVDGGS